MTTLSSSERVDNLLLLSDKTYEAIDQEVDDTTRARRILITGIQAVAHVLNDTHGVRIAGDAYHGILLDELQDGGLPITDRAYDPWPTYREVVMDLPACTHITIVDRQLGELALGYASVERANLNRVGNNETNDSHVAHLSALALPYATSLYPELDPSKVALYLLAHDLLERYAGDTPSLGASDEVMQAKAKSEAKALRQLEIDFGEFYPGLIKVTTDYEELSDDEARFVKTFDKLDPCFSHIYTSGSVLKNRFDIKDPQTFYRLHRQTTRRMRPYAWDFPDALSDHEELALRIIDQSWPDQKED